jgi:hypothetical protein|tara:strand:- start:39 stop:194 length:156 start_codon:yes stop_codon:yes gene_type:complete
MHHNQVKIDQAYRKKQREAGIVPVRVMVPADKVSELKAIAQKWREGHNAPT